MDEAKMVLSYNKLWKMLIDRKLKKKDLQKMTHLSSSVIAKMGARRIGSLRYDCENLHCPSMQYFRHS